MLSSFPIKFELTQPPGLFFSSLGTFRQTHRFSSYWGFICRTIPTVRNIHLFGLDTRTPADLAMGHFRTAGRGALANPSCLQRSPGLSAMCNILCVLRSGSGQCFWDQLGRYVRKRVHWHPAVGNQMRFLFFPTGHSDSLSEALCSDIVLCCPVYGNVIDGSWPLFLSASFPPGSSYKVYVNEIRYPIYLIDLPWIDLNA